MPVSLEIFAIFISETAEAFLLPIKKLTLIKRFVFIYKLAFPTNLPFVPLSFVIIFKRSYCEVDFACSVWLEFSKIDLALIPSTIFVLNVSFFLVEVFDYNLENIGIFFELDGCIF